MNQNVRQSLGKNFKKSSSRMEKVGLRINKGKDDYVTFMEITVTWTQRLKDGFKKVDDFFPVKWNFKGSERALEQHIPNSEADHKPEN